VALTRRLGVEHTGTMGSSRRFPRGPAFRSSVCGIRRRPWGGHLALASARGQPRATRLLGLFVLGGVGLGAYLSPNEAPGEIGGTAATGFPATEAASGNSTRRADASPRLQGDTGNAAFEALLTVEGAERESATALGAGLLHLAAMLGDARRRSHLTYGASTVGSTGGMLVIVLVYPSG
jgi:hypothetical protein